MSIILYSQIFISGDDFHNDEMTQARNINESLDFVDKIVYIAEEEHGRLTYQKFFQIASESDKDAFHVLHNSDIFFDETLKQISNFITDETFLAISRIEKNGSRLHPDVLKMSQDAWVVTTSGAKRMLSYPTDFHLGILGCDNRIVRIANDHCQMTVVNPGLTIKVWHNHENESRNYPDAKIASPYLFVVPV